MDWRVALSLIIVVVLVLAFVTLGVVIAQRGKKISRLRGEVMKWKGKWREALEQLARMLDYEATREMTDDEAYNALLDAINSWDPLCPTGADDDGS